jgi:3-dehydroquinate dehydratase type I
VNGDLAAIKSVESLVDLYEVRIDLIGSDWNEVARQLTKPWIACNRKRDEGGIWRGSEEERLAELLHALGPGAEIIDIELRTENLSDVVTQIKEKAKCLISYHDTEKTPSIAVMKELVQKQLAAGADICKVVTCACNDEDNLVILKLIPQFPEVNIIAFAMGSMGLPSRILSPLVGGYVTYAAIEKGAQSAPGQMTVTELYDIYKMVQQ